MAISGDVKALVQTLSGVILAGTTNKASIYKSTDDGLTWSLVVALASGADTGTVNALVRTNDGKLFAAVSGSAAVQGIWKNDAGDGVAWTRVKSHPRGAGYGYLGITAIQGFRLVASGYGTASSGDGPILVSNDGGATWLSAFVPLYTYDYIGVAAAPDGVLPTNYPGDSATFVPAFFGSNSYYTVAGRAGLSGGAATAVMTSSGKMGNGGLAMAAFLVKVGSSYYSRAVWAVKAEADTSRTELWMFPASQTGPYNFVYNQTLAVLFNVLYVDPVAWQNIGAQRTLWAGANGSIYVSYNSGLSWAVATDAPAGQVYAFVRSTTGYLIAGGASGEITRFGSGSGSEGGGGGGGTPPGDGGGGTNPPTDPIPPEAPSNVATRFLGQNETVEEEVFVANKSSFSNITHVFYYNGSTYINLQFGAEPPYSLLGATPAVGRAVYFGSRTSDANVPGGPFSSIVFNLTYAAANLTIVWEYWNGASWSALTVQDNTASFAVTGVRSVQWIPPANWATTAVNSVTGYWVRARVSATAAGPVGPVHSSRYVYTPNLAYIEVAASEIGGTLPALAQILWRNQGDNPAGSPDMKSHRLLLGLRSVARGPAFDAFLNLSDKQMPFGVTISNPNNDGSFESNNGAPTGRRYSVSYAGGGDLNSWQDLVKIALATTVARDYYGDYRAFLRGQIAGGTINDWQFRLALGAGSGGPASYTPAVAAKPVATDFRLWDLGPIHLPSASLGAAQLSDQMTITIQGYATATGNAAKLYDLILLPVDEWAGDFAHTNLTNANLPSGIYGGEQLDVDSITNPKATLSVYNRAASGLIKAIYQPISNGQAFLQMGQQQRLWFLASQYDFSGSSWGALPAVAGTVRVNKVQQYLGLRGAG